MDNKFTHKEFIERHVEFLMNYSTKYAFQDLDFRSVMYMSGCDEGEFKEHMDKMHAAITSKHITQDWGDENDDDDYSSDDKRVGGDNDGDDSNEY